MGVNDATCSAGGKPSLAGSTSCRIAEGSASYFASTGGQDVLLGYKQTELGILPEDWRVASLRSLLKVPPSYGINAAAVAFDETLPTYLRITDIGEDGRFRPSPRVSVRSPAAERYFLEEGDLVLARTGASVGKSYLYSSSDGSLVFAGFLIRVSPQPDWLAPTYLAYYAQTRLYWNWVSTVSVRSGQPGINGKEYGSLKVPLPRPAEQRAIAEALSNVDGLLGALDALIAKKRAIKQAAMQQLLTGKTRLPSFSEEWETKPLGELSEIRSGGTPSTGDPSAWGGDIPWCTPTDITALDGHKYLVATSRTITAHGLKNSSAELIPAGSVIMTSRATIGECAVNLVPVTTNQGFKNFVPSECVHGEFLYYLLTNQKAGFVALCGGSTFLEIGKSQLRSYQVRTPANVEEQAAISAVLSAMDAEISGLERRRDKTRAIKQGMMQQLLTGRVRLVQPAGEADARRA